MRQFHSLTLILPLVKHAKNLARQKEYRDNYHDGGRRLQRLFAPHFHSPTSCGMGIAWLARPIAQSTSFVRVEQNRSLAVVNGAWKDARLDALEINNSSIKAVILASRVKYDH